MATARVRVTVENRPPDRPVIVRPESDDMVVATGPVATRTGEAVPMADSVGETYRQRLRWKLRCGMSPAHGSDPQHESASDAGVTSVLKIASVMSQSLAKKAADS
jgi:hypothetical protein